MKTLYRKLIIGIALLIVLVSNPAFGDVSYCLYSGAKVRNLTNGEGFLTDNFGVTQMPGSGAQDVTHVFANQGDLLDTIFVVTTLAW